MSIPCITIHGVGNHSMGDIKKRVESNLAKSSLNSRVEVTEFNWDKLPEHAQHTGIVSLFWFLDKTAFTISASARIGLNLARTSLDRFLGSAQFHLIRVGQWLISLSISLLVAGLTVQLAIRLPTSFVLLLYQYEDAFNWLPTAITWLWTLIKAVVFCILVLGVVRGIANSSLRSFLVTLRSVSLLLFQPILVFISAPLVISWKPWVLGVWWLMALPLFTLLYDYAHSVITHQTFKYGLTLEVVLFLLFVPVVLLALRILFSKGWFEGPIKVLLDIFRYLGEPNYRAQVQAELDETVKAKDAHKVREGDFNIVLLTHSLGTVIAVDSLVNSRIWKRSYRVLLVTMGSPIRRFFLNFFPGILFPCSLPQIANLIATRVRSLHWLNVYRPWDYVGTSLGLSGSGLGLDRSTGQWGRIFSSHSDYWLDANGTHVRNAVVTSFKDLMPVPLNLSAQVDSSTYILPNQSTCSARQSALINGANTTAALILVGMFIGMFWWIGQALDTRNTAISNRNTELQEKGKIVKAKITYERTTQGGAKHAWYVHLLKFEYVTLEDLKKSVELNLDERIAFHEIRERFDDLLLTDYIREDCPSSRWELLFWNDNIHCSRAGIRLRYLPSNVEYFDLPDFPPKKYRQMTYGGWIRVAIAAIVISGLLSIPIVAAYRLFLLLLGHSTFSRRIE